MSIAHENRIRALEVRVAALEHAVDERFRALEDAITRPTTTVEPPPAFLNPKQQPQHVKKG